MDFKDLFKNIEGMKGQMETVRARMAKMQITGEAGAGLVKVTVNGKGLVTRVSIDPSLMNASEREMLEELITSAINEAQHRAREAAAHELKNVAGLNIPGLDKLFGG